ncbi:unnamed protein product [Parascedosporium putredinis]|uniref:Uncharacterized protein n=1 Tax=Parascedosporium putredinis TaxID=1442378 RepID=A0A9P1GYB4_9PEZI|nr:unnamed protein product [Parascedosporium putredinis]CAI7990598.1 unnamed protein product [Parascedosporium putredinis]
MSDQLLVRERTPPPQAAVDSLRDHPSSLCDLPSSPPAADQVVARPASVGRAQLPDRPTPASDPDQELSPVPTESMSPPSSIIINPLRDEIVVSSHGNGIPHKPSFSRVSGGDWDTETLDDSRGTVEPRRGAKRSLLPDSPPRRADIHPDRTPVDPPRELEPRRTKVVRRAVSSQGLKGVVLGYWRDSRVPNVADRHAVIGFIDVRDRLRTQIQNTTRSGKPRIVFVDHLVGLDQHHVKEYVKVRSDMNPTDANDTSEADLAARAEAIGRLKLNPVSDSAPPAPMAYGEDVPEALLTPPEPIARISVEERDKHAVYGILGQNDMFRVKLVRETRDGRYINGNFPIGAGALWIHYDEVHFEPHLESLSRTEVKEYCRIRQYQLDHDEETEEQRAVNEDVAIRYARERVAAGFRGYISTAAPKQTRSSMAEVRPNYNESSNHRAASELVERTSSIAQREIARAEAAQLRQDRYAATKEAAVAAAAAVSPTSHAGPYPACSPPGSRPPFHESDDMMRLNSVWARQEAQRIRNAGQDDAKIYNGIKYERKATGPFQGRFVSQGTIISIDGDDYVEYRVLTKPCFF